MLEDLTTALQALRAGGATVYPLLALAMVASIVILEKAFVFWSRSRLPARVTRIIETDGFKWSELVGELHTAGERSYPREFLETIVLNRTRPSWWIESHAGGEAALVEKALGRWLWVLETIVTAAPLLGLLGTITGMIRAFNLFGNQNLVDPVGVTGGVAEALIATAIGLFIALVSLFAYNYLTQQRALVMDELERLATRLTDRIRLDQETGGHEAS